MTKTLFRNIVGTSPESKALEYFLEWKGLDLTLVDLCEGASIGRNQACRLIKHFEESNIITKTRKVGKAQLYSLNKEDGVSKALAKLFDVILKKELDKY